MLVSVRNRYRRYVVEKADRERFGHDRHEVPAAAISEGPGTVVRRARVGGLSAPDDYRADHGYKAISTHPRLVTSRIGTKPGVEL